MLRAQRIVSVAVLFLLAGFCFSPVANAAGPIIELTVEGPIGPATEDYLQRALQSAAGRGATLVVIRMDTPGGLDSAMRGIIKTITNSSVPVASYVAPTGARDSHGGSLRFSPLPYCASVCTRIRR